MNNKIVTFSSTYEKFRMQKDKVARMTVGSIILKKILKTMRTALMRMSSISFFKIPKIAKTFHYLSLTISLLSKTTINQSQ